MLTFVPDLRTRRNDLTSPRKAGALIPIGSEQSTQKVTKSVNNREIPLKFFQHPGNRVPLDLNRGEERREGRDIRFYSKWASFFVPIHRSRMTLGIARKTNVRVRSPHQ